MKRFFKNKWIFLMLFIVWFYHSCVFHKITHMNGEELEWITNRQKGEILYFKSQYGDLDTVVIYSTHIYNSLNPINFEHFETGRTESLAGGAVQYYFSDMDGVQGYFGIIKLHNGKPLQVSGHLFYRFVSDAGAPLKLSSINIGDITLDDVILFDDSNLKPIEPEKSDNPVLEYAWSKKYGLVQYEFLDGTIFSRIDI